MKNIFVGNLNASTTPETVRTLLQSYADAAKFKLMTERRTGVSRGFGFVELPAAQAGQAIAALNGATLDGHTIEVREARQKLHRTPESR